MVPGRCRARRPLSSGLTSTNAGPARSPRPAVDEPAYYSTDHDEHGWGQIVIRVSERVPGERARLVVTGRRTEDGSQCTVIVIHEEDGTWAIHGLGNQGVRVSEADIVALGKAVLERER